VAARGNHCPREQSVYRAATRRGVERAPRDPVGLRAERREFGFQVAAEHDVGAAASHVGRDGHGAGTSGVGNDPGLALVLLFWPVISAGLRAVRNR